MGAAFGKGYVKKLKELLAKYGHSDILISLVADFDPYQASQLSADPNIHTLQFTHKGIIADQRQKTSLMTIIGKTPNKTDIVYIVFSMIL